MKSSIPFLDKEQEDARVEIEGNDVGWFVLASCGGEELFCSPFDNSHNCS